MSTVIADIIQQLDTATYNYVFKGYAALADSISHPLYLAVIAYVAFVGWSTSQSWAPMNIGEAAKHSIKLGLVVVFATNWDLFSVYFYNLVTNGPNEISAVLVGASGGSASTSNQALQASFDKGLEMGMMIWNKGGLKSLSYYFAAIIVFIFDFAVSGIALVALATAKCGVAVTIVLAPVFSIFLLFKSGQGFFNGWLQAVLGFSFVPLVVSSVILLINPILEIGLSAITAESAGQTIICLSTFILGSMVAYALLKKSDGIAAQMAGGFSISVGESMGHAVRDVATGIGMAKKMKEKTIGFGKGSVALGKKAAAFGKGTVAAGKWAADKLRGGKEENFNK